MLRHQRRGRPPAAHFRLDLASADGDARRATLPHPEIFAALKVGTELLLDDGKLRLRVDAFGPAFAIDVASLGGLYAGKITLVGTEAGVGVRNAGTLGASVGEVTVTVDGRLQNSGSLMARGDIALNTPGSTPSCSMTSRSRPR